jgi:glucose-1-phosphate cytidylyltransferase
MMKAVILCGGRGTRLGEHGKSIPKALVEIGGRPILWHLLNLYAHQGVSEFILCLGYLGEEIRQYFSAPENGQDNDWKVTAVDTGLDTNTGGRLKLVEKYLRDEKSFHVTYGDGLADIDIKALTAFHEKHGRLATVTAVRPRSSFGILQIDADGVVSNFLEKPLMNDWVNGGFFVFDRGIFNYLTDESVLECQPLQQLAKEGQIRAYQHPGFWKCLDTYKDRLEFNRMWESGEARWHLRK